MYPHPLSLATSPCPFPHPFPPPRPAPPHPAPPHPPSISFSCVSCASHSLLSFMGTSWRKRRSVRMCSELLLARSPRPLPSIWLITTRAATKVKKVCSDCAARRSGEMPPKLQQLGRQGRVGGSLELECVATGDGRSATTCFAQHHTACLGSHTCLRGRACPSAPGCRRGGDAGGEAHSGAASAARPQPLPPGWGLTALPATLLSASGPTWECTVQQQGGPKPSLVQPQFANPGFCDQSSANDCASAADARNICLHSRNANNPVHLTR